MHEGPALEDDRTDLAAIQRGQGVSHIVRGAGHALAPRSATAATTSGRAATAASVVTITMGPATRVCQIRADRGVRKPESERAA